MTRRLIVRNDVAGVFLNAGLNEEARAVYLQVSDEAHRLGDSCSSSRRTTGWAGLTSWEGRYEAAEIAFRLVIEFVRGLGYATWEAETLRGLGLAMLGLGRRAEARAALMASLEILAADPGPNAELIATLRYIAFATEPADVRTAAHLARAVVAIRRSARLAESPTELDLRHRFEQPLIEALGEEEWSREHSVGATLTLEEAIELARTLAAAGPETTPASA